MTEPPVALEAYLAGGGRSAGALVTDLDRAIRAAHPGFDVAVRYHMLMYTAGRDWRHWVCAIGTTGSGVALRCLFGVLLDDPRHVLRPGTSVMMKSLDDGMIPAPRGDVAQTIRSVSYRPRIFR